MGTHDGSHRRRRLRVGPDLQAGSQPDYRFSLANERTLLAYVRTALALNAGGLAAATLLPADEVAGRELLGGGLVALGAVRLGAAVFALLVGATFQWAAFRDARLQPRDDATWIRPTRVRAVLGATAVVQLVSFAAVVTSTG